MFRYGVLVPAVTIVACLVGVQWGPVGIAAAYSGTALAMRYPNLMYCFHKSPVQMRDLVRALWTPASASVMAALCLYLANTRFPLGGTAVAGLLIDFAVFVIGYILAWSLLPGGVEELRRMIRLVGDLRRTVSDPSP